MRLLLFRGVPPLAFLTVPHTPGKCDMKYQLRQGVVLTDEVFWLLGKSFSPMKSISVRQYSVWDLWWGKMSQMQAGSFPRSSGFSPRNVFFPPRSLFLIYQERVQAGLPDGAKPRDSLSLRSCNYNSMKMEQIECSETSAYIIQTPGNYPKENIIYSEYGESLKSRM